MHALKSRNVREKEPLSHHTTMKVGGPASYFATPENVQELQSLIARLRKEHIRYVILGRGSNLIFSDKGYKGCVISLKKLMALTFSGKRVRVGAGLPLSSLILKCAAHNLSGLEKLIGIPASVGGAVANNVGAYGVQTSDVLESVTVLTPQGTKILPKSKLSFAYHRGMRGHIIVEATFKLVSKPNTFIQATIKQTLIYRTQTQPLSEPSAGSTFINPKSRKAWQLIEAAGLKGFQKGGAKVSEHHANWIVNTGNATSRDIVWLIRHIQKTVKKKSGVLLQPEVEIIPYG
ncbi:UDP-N-acetylmuramate dehydrogenase [Candidatus Woesearchaeota archaeon]|nr:UDP-N-acetylmuramate dehydrogenase [Candidatus Woesearchaeota archaeon]